MVICHEEESLKKSFMCKGFWPRQVLKPIKWKAHSLLATSIYWLQMLCLQDLVTGVVKKLVCNFPEHHEFT